MAVEATGHEDSGMVTVGMIVRGERREASWMGIDGGGKFSLLVGIVGSRTCEMHEG